ncbi:unnamed protein product [Nippostrongylus brasiliensis]|uniref:Na(+)/dicarboxylate symporter n=1 Tax=Nippostrongylus brasiliensis TaxID=27835 RepID=A0A0N4YFJ5_NIPBR|nr:unnamed protein product [Nippostrongylus brasiliensis]
MIGTSLSTLNHLPLWVLQGVTMAIAMAVTNICSNTVTATIFVNIVAELAPAMSRHPFTLMLPTTLACSFAFVLPVGTPPNAIVFGSGMVKVSDMAVFADRTLSIMLMHLENPQGVLSNGDECSAFSFAGVQCSMQMDIRVDLGDGSPQLHKLGQVSYGSNSVDFTVNTYGEWTNPLVISLGEKFYKGFDLLVEIKDMDGNAIDSWNATFADDTQLRDVYTYTSHRGTVIGTS